MVCLFIAKVLCLYSDCHASSHLFTILTEKHDPLTRGRYDESFVEELSSGLSANQMPRTITVLVEVCRYQWHTLILRHEIGWLKIDLVYKDFRTP